MNKCMVVQFLLIGIIYAASEHYTADYSWKDFEGKIPPDALVGGLDRNAQPIYIGQVLFENKLIPGKIYKNDDKIYFQWFSKEYSTNQNVKILCSQQPQKFKWLPTRNNEVYSLSNRMLIKGGFEPNYITYIGHTLLNGETTVGKVICRSDDCLGLYTTDNGQTHEHHVFQILSYHPEIASIDNCNPAIDFRIGSE